MKATIRQIARAMLISSRCARFVYHVCSSLCAVVLVCAATGNRLGHIETDTGGIRVFGSTITGEPEKISGIRGEHDNEAFRWCTNDSSVIISRAGPQCVLTTGLSLSLCFVGLNVYCFCWADRIRIAKTYRNVFEFAVSRSRIDRRR